MDWSGTMTWSRRGPTRRHSCKTGATPPNQSNHDSQCDDLTMRIAHTIKVAYRALRRNKMRSVLTALGIVIGVGAVIAMVGIGNGAKAQVEAQIASLGEN